MNGPITISLSKDSAAVLAASITATVALLVALTTTVVTVRMERSRMRNAVGLRRLEFSESRKAALHAELRSATAQFAATAVSLGQVARAIERDREAGATPDDELEQKLLEINGQLRAQYQMLLLLSESTAVQIAARLVVRAAWNEREQSLGRTRKHDRMLDSSASPVKEMRAWLRPLTEAVRAELGVQGDLAPESTD
jgi:hypothetical protein